MSNFLQEFKEFAIKGNMIDMAVGIIIGAAFNKVVNVIVKEIFLPPLSFLTDGINWENKRWVLREAVVVDGVAKPEEIAIGYGKLFEVSVDFFVVALTVFIVVKFMNRLRKKSHDAKDETVNTPKDIELLDKVADLLEKQNEILMSDKPGDRDLT